MAEMNEQKQTIVGRLISADSRSYSFCCLTGSIPDAQLGTLVRATVNRCDIYALITNVELAENGLVRHIAATPEIAPAIVEDNQINLTAGPTIRAWFVGYDKGFLRHTLPPQPPMALSEVYVCDADVLRSFTQNQSYLRLLYQAQSELPLADVIAAHVDQTAAAQQAIGNHAWLYQFTEALVDLLIDDIPTARLVLSAIIERISTGSTSCTI
jgi:hypothetical protein